MTKRSATPLSEPVISLDQVEKTFSRGKETVRAVASTSFQIQQGEFVSLLGPSGCGKSTLLRLIMGLDTPTSGCVEVNGKTPEQSQGAIGVMLQTPALMPWQTVRNNIALPARLKGVSVNKLNDRIDTLLKMVGLSAFASAYPGTLSGGMQQRVALARALLFDPNLLMLDEPFGALDHITREQLNIEMASLCAQGNKTTILVTHDISEAIFLSDRIVVMTARPGRVEEILTVDLPKPRNYTMQTHPRFEELTTHIRKLLGIGSINA